MVVSKAPSKTSKKCEDENEVKAQLCTALIDNQRLQMELEAMQGGGNTRESEKLKQKLADALAEVEELKRVAADHKNCPKSRPNSPAPSPITSSHSPVTSSHTPVKVPSSTTLKSKPISPAPSPITSSHSPDAVRSPVTSSHTPVKVPSSTSLKSRPISPAPSPITSSHSPVAVQSPVTSSHTPVKVPSSTVVQQEHKTRWPDPKSVILSEGEETFSRRIMPVTSRVMLLSAHDFYTTQEVTYVENKDEPSNVKILPGLTPSLEKVKSLLSKRRLGGSQPVTLDPAASGSHQISNCESADSKQEGAGSQPPSLKTHSSHAVEEVLPEPIQKPVLFIVSKHEFDSVLLKKKKYYSETEVVVPAQESETLNCRLEICIYDLEVDHRLLDHLLELENDPRIFVVWDFVGLQHRTSSMPAKKAHFHTNVTYYGPVSKNMVDYVKECEVPVYLMLERPNNNKGEQVALGYLDLIPAIEHPTQGFVRCITLASSEGSATVYCSFKVHTCCQGEEIPKGESLEIGIGHLKLNNPDVLASRATHLYVEYSLLGHNGPELETDSKPKADVVRFNYTKRLSINDHNANTLQPLLKEDNPEPLKFILLSEPCNLTQKTDVVELGYAEINLMEEMVHKDQDVISAQLPVYDKDGDHLGSLSVTVIGHDTLQSRVGTKQRS